MESLRKSPKSPKFMKPSEVFKMRKKKRLSQSPSSMKSPIKSVYSPLKCLENYQNSKEVLAQKTFSPFKQKRTPNKKNKIRNSFPIVKKSPKGKRHLNFHTLVNNTNNVLNIDENANIESTNITSNSVQKRESKQYLIDWSLKTKLRFFSTKAFGFRGNFRATEEATGICGFVRCLHKKTIDSSQSSQDSMDSSFASLLQKQCLVWSHPSLPWLTLFPRNKNPMPGTPVASKAPTFSIMPNTPLADALHTDWCSSLKSLYQLLKAKQCPYFYVCANAFTALFRASGIAGFDDIQVLLTPTTTGLRKLLTDEGIVYSLPFYDNKSTSENTNASIVSINSCPVLSDLVKNNDNDNCDNAEEEEPTVWLESLGLSQHDFPSLQPKRKNRSAENSVTRLKSLVLVKGMSNSQMFLNFLINTRICISNSGPLSGIPPTLLSPIAFHGSTLQSLKIKQTISETTGNDSLHCLEVNGPILPNSVKGLIALLKESHGFFKGSLITYEPTASFTSFNVCKENNSSSKAFAIENLKDCGIDKQFLNIICSDDYRTDVPISEVLFNNSGIFYN